MKYVVNSKEMKTIEAYTIDDVGIPSYILMERAALAVVAFIKSKISRLDHILVVCGIGNNGGDGIAIGRILVLEGYQVTISILGNLEHGSVEAKKQYEILKNISGLSNLRIDYDLFRKNDIKNENLLGKFENNNKLDEYNIIIDAIFGIGITRPVVGVQENAIKMMNNSNCTVISVDIPSGISADTGDVMGVAIHANYTITFEYLKIGLLLYPGAEYGGEVIVAPIGLPPMDQDKAQLLSFYYEKDDLIGLPPRYPHSDKGNYGKVLIVAGGPGMSGAAYLSAFAAYRTGAGLVKILTSEKNRVVLQTLLPEAIVVTYDEEDVTNESQMSMIKEAIKWASCIAIGPGLGKNEFQRKLLSTILEDGKVPIVIDADGLQLLSDEMKELGIHGWDRKEYLNHKLPKDTILTPHVKEFSDLFDQPLETVKTQFIDHCIYCGQNINFICGIKDARTVVVTEGKCYINQSGNHGMATGGSGDVLTGIIAGLLGQGLKSYEATTMGVYLHGLAGDKIGKSRSKAGMIASDIVDGIGLIYHELEKSI